MPKLMHALGLLEDKIVETTAMEIQGQYVGHSAAKAREKIQAASGGVLFVDEAHNFLGTGSFAIEAAKVLMTATLEPEHKGRTMLIFAGYERKMNTMMQHVDDGMRRRFKETIRFPDWTPQNCFDFVVQLCKRKDIDIAEDAQHHILEQLKIIYERPGWGNASDAHVTFEYIENALAMRTRPFHAGAAEPAISDQLNVITLQDAIMGMDKFHLQRPDMELPQSGTSTDFGVGFAHFQSPGGASPPHKPRIKRIEERETHSLITQTRDGEFDEDPVFAALQLACVELGYDADQESRTKLIGILEVVQAGGGLSKDILDHVKSKTGENETNLQQMLRPQVPPLLKSMSAAFAAEEERILVIKRLEEQKRLEEAEALRKKYEDMQRRLHTMGVCPAGFSWYRQGGGWRCHGGSHWVSDDQLQ
jgi:hypothetical protein